VELLLQAGAENNVEAGTGGDWTAFHNVARCRSKETVEAFLRHGVDVDFPTANGRLTVLNLASTYANADMVEHLLSLGANPNTVGWGGFTPLHNAAYNSRSEIVRSLITHGARVNARSERGLTPLHSATLAYGAFRETKEAIANYKKRADKAGFEPNVEGEDRRTALDVANEVKVIIKLLIDAGADPEAKSELGSTALPVALQGGQATIDSLQTEIVSARKME
jgi:ankyrin repeat protein